MLRDDTSEEGLYGLQIAQGLRMPTGSVFPILGRLERAGWIVGTWEDPEQAALAKRRRRRRYYRLTLLGRRAAIEVVSEDETVWAQRFGLQGGGAPA
jgi:PadR family transcriptional regulator, regulatory protein PadR